jgi:signal transduction histidine kinase
VALRRPKERPRIARELHDSLTHDISVMKVQAGVAVHLARKRGEPLSDALLAIQAASTDTARELRGTLHVLRNGDTNADAEADSTSCPTSSHEPATPDCRSPGSCRRC